MYSFQAVIIPSDIDITPLSFIMLEDASQRFFRLTRLLDHKGFTGMYSTCIQTYLRSVFFYVKSSHQCFLDMTKLFSSEQTTRTRIGTNFLNACFGERLGPREIRNGYTAWVNSLCFERYFPKYTIFSSPYIRVNPLTISNIKAFSRSAIRRLSDTGS